MKSIVVIYFGYLALQVSSKLRDNKKKSEISTELINIT